MRPRREVEWFAGEMENKLRRRDKKWGGNGWKEETLGPLVDRLGEETEELREVFIKLASAHVMRSGNVSGPLSLPLTQTQSRRIIREAADVANFAMMIAERAQASVVTSARPTRRG